MVESYLYVLFFVVAFLYASVGHGGASGYLAIFALMGWMPEQIRIYALTLNIIVSSISFIFFVNKKDFPIKDMIWLLVGSIPLAYIGGTIMIDASVYKVILGLLLWIPILSLLRVIPRNAIATVRKTSWALILIGASIGLISGMIGMGGGILLSPILLLLGWATVRQVAAMSALFILINSLSGLTGIGLQQLSWSESMTWIVMVVVAGGILGALMGSRRYSDVMIRAMLSIVLVFASVKLIFY